ncbi:MAG: EamA family transporter [Planctomycetaceae bacterium]
MIYGLLAALGWGSADLVAAISGRRIGALLTVAVAQVAGLVALVAVVAVGGEAFHASAGQAAILVVNGAVASGAYIALYRGLELGPVALVSPIVGAYAVVTIILAVVFAGDTLAGFALAGTALTLVGAALAASDLRSLRRGGLRLAGGIPWAIASMLLFGVATFVTGRLAQDMGWASASLVSRIGNTSVVLLVVLLLRGRVPSPRRRSDVAIAVPVGLADIFGLIAYTAGTQRGEIAVVTAASAAFLLIPVFGGLAIFRERPAPNQLAGVVLVFVGLVALGLGH